MSIDKIVIAVGDLDKMGFFYSAVFGVKLNDVDVGNAKMKTGLWGTMEFLLCPKELAGIKANQNTIQLRFVVKDIDLVLKRAKETGGQIITNIQSTHGVKTAAVRDPDGNSIELIQK